MKTNKEFINEIYKKFDEQLEEKQKNKRKYIKNITNIAAIIIIVFSLIIISSENQKPTTITENGKTEHTKSNLKTVGSFENFYNVIKESYKDSNRSFNDLEITDSVAEDIQSTKSKEESITDSSKTNTQEENVDEADIVKVDKEYIYYVTEQKIVIVRADSPENSKKISEINYQEEEVTPKEIYVNNDKLIVVVNRYDNCTSICKTENLATDDTLRIPNNKSGIIIYDISNKEEPKEIRRIEVDGNYLSSRMIDNNIYFVSNKNIYYSEILKNNIEDIDETKYMPRYIDTAIEQQEKCIDYSKIYCLEQIENANYLTLVGLNLDSKEEANIQTFLGAGEYIYSSDKNMYIAISNMKYNDKYEYENSTTRILKFSLNAGKINFVTETDVAGVINNQFSMNENDKFFRIATTIGNIWNIDENTSNNLYVLNDKLEEVGRITGFAKEEKIYSVRYVDSKAYVVTFKQTDPLFVIDLSIPQNPQILGELKLPGYSTYLHPYDENHMIGFGYDTKEDGTRISTNGLKMVMFDISDLNNPKELFKVTIADRYSNSELIYNHKALLYSKEKNIIAFPVTSYSNGKTNSRAEIYEIDLEKGFVLKGQISSNVSNDYKKEIQRIIYVNDTYYTLSRSTIKVADVNTLSVIKEIEI